MPHMFGARPLGAVEIVDTPVSQWYARRARMAFVGVGVMSAMVGAGAAAALSAPVLLALLVGVLAGVVCGFVAAVLVRMWPGVRVLWWWSIEIAVGALIVFGPS